MDYPKTNTHTQPKPYLHPDLSVSMTENKGWGIYASKDIPSDQLIECSPVIIMPSSEKSLLDNTLLHDYIFDWDEPKGKCIMAMGYVPIYNHACPSNAEYIMHLDDGLISIYTVTQIQKGEEICINYMGDFDNPKPVWFSLKD